ncbi:MAG: DUF547 domain-containing protein [Alphaproteobacteria bacterium]
MMNFGLKTGKYAPAAWAMSCLMMVFIGLSAPVQAQNSAEFSADHSPWGQLLGTYVSAHKDGVNRFDYGAVTTQDRATLDAYLEMLASKPVSKAARGQQMAFWINLYNALTVQVILDNYPVDSIRQITNGFLSFGPWKVKRITVEGQQLSLDAIEHDILRPQFRDPRIHYAVNCASWGCPNLQQQAFTADNLELLLDQGARAYINHERGVTISDAGRLIVSSIYDWFKADFGHDDDQVLGHIRTYADAALLDALSGHDAIDGYEYDWTLNAPDRNKGDY